MTRQDAADHVAHALSLACGQLDISEESRLAEALLVLFAPTEPVTITRHVYDPGDVERVKYTVSTDDLASLRAWFVKAGWFEVPGGTEYEVLRMIGGPKGVFGVYVSPKKNRLTACAGPEQQEARRILRAWAAENGRRS